jgi:general secretion pathway protein K
LKLSYPQAPDLAVRIYDHAGKINLRQISRPRLRALIEKKLGGSKADSDQVDQMMDCWNDWLDLNDGKSPKGAEKEYYMALPVPYMPRNGALETVEELLSIKGFAEVFGDVDLEAAFTLYGPDELVNLNVATVEAMQLLPGLDDQLIEKIVAWRKDNEFQGNGDVAQIVPVEKMADLRPWINSRKTTDYYTIMVYPDASAKDKQAPLTGYAETVFVPTPAERPTVLKINPYQKLPASPDALAANAGVKP